MDKGQELLRNFYGQRVQDVAQSSKIISYGDKLDKVNKNCRKAVSAVNKSQNIVNHTETAILINGYYEVNGFKFTEYYYNRLWSGGRKAPSLTAQAILDHVVKILPDPKGYDGFYKYISDGWYMIYNPTTKIVSHLEPLK